ncbi:MAG: hypothetical protein NT067_07205 [Candidatus Diapherotrites archaeon]|nr:hypothetical protein [Candidatus Diapherotrites archaeon]
MAKPARIKTPADVRGLTITRDPKKGAIEIGEGQFGTCFTGRIRWKNGTRHRVVVKRFNPEGWITHSRSPQKPFAEGRSGPMTSKEAEHYQKVIDELRMAGVRVPKMGIYQVTERDAEANRWQLRKGEWVLVSNLFGGTKRGSLLDGDLASSPTKWSADARRDIIDQATRIANTGYGVSNDCIKFFEGRGDKKGVVIDIDYQALSLHENRGSPEGNAEKIASLAEKLADPSLPWWKLMGIALKRVDRKSEKGSRLEKALLKEIQKRQSRFERYTVRDAGDVVRGIISFERTYDPRPCTAAELKSLLRSTITSEGELERILDFMGARAREKKWIKLETTLRNEDPDMEYAIRYDKETGVFSVLRRKTREKPAKPIGSR